uniref:(-)-germacrene D synthase n=1 Tax=Heterorhabditis bacteriophora TaxID=37862 RepID=A0A1I7X7U2_HETBA
MCHFGMLATDITRLLNTSTSPEDRRLNWKNYLKVYYDEMIRVLNGSSAPFSLEQLELTYRIVYPRVASFLIPALFALFHSTMKIFKGNEGTGARKILLEKIVSIYEDIIDHHENKPSNL